MITNQYDILLFFYFILNSLFFNYKISFVMLSSTAHPNIIISSPFFYRLCAFSVSSSLSYSSSSSGLFHLAPSASPPQPFLSFLFFSNGNSGSFYEKLSVFATSTDFNAFLFGLEVARIASSEYLSPLLLFSYL